MEKNTKILLGLAAAGVVAYLVLKPKVLANTQVSIPPMSAKMPDVNNVPMSNIDWKKLMDGIDMSKSSQMCPDCGTIGGNPIPINNKDGGYDGSGINPYGMYNLEMRMPNGINFGNEQV